MAGLLALTVGGTSSSSSSSSSTSSSSSSGASPPPCKVNGVDGTCIFTSMCAAMWLRLDAWQQLLPLRPDAARLNDPVFRSRKKKDGARLRPLAILRMVRKASSRAGVDLPVSPHWFRHAHAPTRSTAAHPSTWSRPPWATPALPLPADISTPGRKKAPPDSSLYSRLRTSGPRRYTVVSK